MSVTVVIQYASVFDSQQGKGEIYVATMHTSSRNAVRLWPVVLVLLGTCVWTSEALTCSSCQLTTCPVLEECPAGVVKDVCNCCTECANGKGERCGGPFDTEGKCGVGLYCTSQRRQDIPWDSREVGVCESKYAYNCTDFMLMMQAAHIYSP